MRTQDATPARAPLYARVLRLRHVRVGGFASFALFECVIALGVLLALAELVTWWAVPALPAAVAVMVKVNDLVVGSVRPTAMVAGSGDPRERVGPRRAMKAGASRHDNDATSSSGDAFTRVGQRRGAGAHAGAGGHAGDGADAGVAPAGNATLAGSDAHSGGAHSGGRAVGRAVPALRRAVQGEPDSDAEPSDRGRAATSAAGNGRAGARPTEDRPPVGAFRITVPPRAPTPPGRPPGARHAQQAGQVAGETLSRVEGQRSLRDDDGARARGTLNQGRFA